MKKALLFLFIGSMFVDGQAMEQRPRTLLLFGGRMEQALRTPQKVVAIPVAQVKEILEKISTLKHVIIKELVSACCEHRPVETTVCCEVIEGDDVWFDPFPALEILRETTYQGVPFVQEDGTVNSVISDFICVYKYDCTQEQVVDRLAGKGHGETAFGLLLESNENAHSLRQELDAIKKELGLPAVDDRVDTEDLSGSLGASELLAICDQTTNQQCSHDRENDRADWKAKKREHTSCYNAHNNSRNNNKNMRKYRNNAGKQ